jgi:hypothetical protein
MLLVLHKGEKITRSKCLVTPGSATIHMISNALLAKFAERHQSHKKIYGRKTKAIVDSKQFLRKRMKESLVNQFTMLHKLLLVLQVIWRQYFTHVIPELFIGISQSSILVFDIHYPSLHTSSKRAIN